MVAFVARASATEFSSTGTVSEKWKKQKLSKPGNGDTRKIQLTTGPQHEVGEDVGQGNDSHHFVILVHDDKSMYLLYK